MYNGTDGALANSENYTDDDRSAVAGGVPPKVLAANPNISPNADIQEMYDAGAWMSGPAIQDKLWFAGTCHEQRLDSYKLGSYNPDGTQVHRRQHHVDHDGEGDVADLEDAQLSYFYNLQYKLIGHRGGGTFADGRARNYNDKYPTVNQVKYNTTIGNEQGRST